MDVLKNVNRKFCKNYRGTSVITMIEIVYGNLVKTKIKNTVQCSDHAGLAADKSSTDSIYHIPDKRVKKTKEQKCPPSRRRPY